MIKNRLVTDSNHIDRYFGSSSLTSSSNVNELWEEDLWPVDTEETDLEAVQDHKDNNCNRRQFVIHNTGFHDSLQMIPRFGDSESNARLRHHHQSALVNVLDWSKILGVDHQKEQNLVTVDVGMAGEEEEEEEEDAAARVPGEGAYSLPDFYHILHLARRRAQGPRHEPGSKRGVEADRISWLKNNPCPSK